MSRNISQNSKLLDSRHCHDKKPRKRNPLTIKFCDLPDEALIPINVVCDICGKRPTAIYDGIKNNTFPAFEKLSSRCSRWRVGQIRRWLADPLRYSPFKEDYQNNRSGNYE